MDGRRRGPRIPSPILASWCALWGFSGIRRGEDGPLGYEYDREFTGFPAHYRIGTYYQSTHEPVDHGPGEPFEKREGRDRGALQGQVTE